MNTKKICVALSLLLLASKINADLLSDVRNKIKSVSELLGISKAKTLPELKTEKSKLEQAKVEVVKQVIVANVEIGNTKNKLTKTPAGAPKNNMQKYLDDLQKTLEPLKKQEKDLFYKIKDIDQKIAALTPKTLPTQTAKPAQPAQKTQRQKDIATLEKEIPELATKISKAAKLELLGLQSKQFTNAATLMNLYVKENNDIIAANPKLSQIKEIKSLKSEIDNLIYKLDESKKLQNLYPILDITKKQKTLNAKLIASK